MPSGAIVEPSSRGDGVPVRLQRQQSNVGNTSEHLALDALTSVLCPWRRKGAKYDRQHGDKATSTTISQLVTLVRRLVVFAAALVYITRSIQSTVTTVRILRAIPLPSAEMGTYRSSLIPLWAGTSSIRASPLVTLALQNATTPINGTIYLATATTASTAGCGAVPAFNPVLYSNTFLRTIATGLLTQTVYNLTFLAPVELVAPVVDCSFDGIALGQQTIVRMHYLVRHKNTTDDVSLLTFSMSVQDYSIPKQKQKGPAAVGTLQIIKDMGMATAVQHYFIVAQSYPYATLKFQVYTMLGRTADHEWRLRSIPSIPMLETPKELVTASRTGMFIDVETEQANYRNANPVLDETPDLMLRQWRWQGGTVLRDSWGWVHCVHALFALDALINLFVLFIIVYRNLVVGKIWVGDAFVSVSNTLLLRGAIVIATWIVNDGWTLMEFCYHNANQISGNSPFYAELSVIRADLLTLFLSLASLLGLVLRERIDPGLVVFLFEIGFAYRTDIADMYPHTKAKLSEYAIDDLARGTLAMSPVVARTTPMRLWTIHALVSKNVGFILLSVVPSFSLLGVVVAVALARKVYRRYYPETLHVIKSSNSSDKSEDLKAIKANLTYFEVATGAALQRRVGVVTDYENCIYIKGTKYASADGIYSTGYVIANGKFLLATTDLMTIVLIKITRVRFKNVYAYEVDASTVQQTARLLYPETIPWRDLLRLNISVLS